MTNGGQHIQIPVSCTSPGCQGKSRLAGAAGAGGSVLPVCQHGMSRAAAVQSLQTGTQISEGGWRSGRGSCLSHCAAFALCSGMTRFPAAVPTAQTPLRGSGLRKLCLQRVPRHISLARIQGRFYILSSAGETLRQAIPNP